MKVGSSELNAESYPPDQRLIQLGYNRRSYFETAGHSSYFNAFGLAHLRSYLKNPQAAANLVSKEIPEQLKEAMQYVASRQVDLAGAFSAQYIGYFFGPYKKIEELYGSTGNTTEAGKWLSQLLQVHIVNITHTEDNVQVNIDYFDGLAPILHLELVQTAYYVLELRDEFPQEVMKEQLQAYYFPQPPEPAAQPAIPDPVPPQPTPEVHQHPPESASDPPPSQPDVPQSPPPQAPDQYWQIAGNLVDTQVKVLQSILKANAILHPGEDTLELLRKAEQLANSLNFDGTEYPKIIAELESRQAKRRAPSPVKPPEPKVITIPRPTPPPQQSESPSKVTQPPRVQPAVSAVPKTGPGKPGGSIARPAGEGFPPFTSSACRQCGKPEQLYLDGNHRNCQLCFKCCAFSPQCPQCQLPFTDEEKARFKIISQ